MQTLQATGDREDIVKVFASWLDKSEAVVIVGGAKASAFTLDNMIYQGTVWGPWLWNIFYEDARQALHKHDYCEIVFADDLNSFGDFPLTEPNVNLTAAA